MCQIPHEVFSLYSPMDGMDCIRESTPTSTTTYLIPQGMLLGFIRDGVTYFVSSDALGSCRLVTDASGVVKARFDHGAFGETLATSFDNVPGGMPYGWVGSLGVRYDSDTQLHYMRQRWFSGSLQRFISRDPIGLQGGENVYVYCDNNPVRYADPTGLIAGPRNVTCAQLKAALASTGGRVPGWVLGMLAGEGNNDDTWPHKLGKEIFWINSMDIGVPPTRARPSNEAYLRGYIPDPMPGAGPNFWELSADQRATALLIFNEKHPELADPIYTKLARVDGNLDTAVNSLDHIGKAMYGKQYPRLTDEQWIDVIVQHDQGGPFGPRGYNGKKSDKLRLRNQLRDELKAGFKAYFDKFCPCG